MGRAGGFTVDGKWQIRLLRIIFGLPCMVLLYIGLQMTVPDTGDFIAYAAWRFLGFYLISFLAVYLLPMLFIRLKCMKSGQ
jgi:hypothetical protein